MHTTVIGAGAVGLSCAFELAERGHDITVIDAGAVGSGASAGNAGWVTPFLATPRASPGVIGDALRSLARRDGPARIHPPADPGFARWILGFLRASNTAQNTSGTAALQLLGRDAVAAFDSLRERGVRCAQHSTGLAVVFKQDNNFRNYEQLIKRMRSLGYQGRAQRYRGAEVRDFDAAISDQVAGAIHFGDECHVRPETLTQGLATALRGMGAVFIEGDPVGSLEIRRDSRWAVGTRAGRTVTSDHVLVAAGFHSRNLLKPLGVDVPIEVAKGTSITATGEGLVPQHALKLYENMVACSPFGRSVRLSGTFDIGARSAAVNDRRLDMVIRHGLSYLYDWRPTDVEIRWAGHRPTTIDDLPVLGAVPGQRGLYIATGHGTLGITLGPVTGARLAAEITSGEDDPVLAPFRLDRFARRIK